MPGRRSSWKTSTLRRSRGSGAATTNGSNNHAIGGTNGIANGIVNGRGRGNHSHNRHYKKQLNPYKSSTQSSTVAPLLRDSVTRGITADDNDDDLGIDDIDGLGDLADEDDDDDLGLDNILSSLTGINDNGSGIQSNLQVKQAPPVPPPPPSSSSGDANKKPDASLDGLLDVQLNVQSPFSGGNASNTIQQVLNDGHHGLGANDFSIPIHSGIEPGQSGAPSSSSIMGGNVVVANEKKEMMDMAIIPPRRPNISHVNFGDEGGESRLHPSIEDDNLIPPPRRPNNISQVNLGDEISNVGESHHHHPILQNTSVDLHDVDNMPSSRRRPNNIISQVNFGDQIPYGGESTPPIQTTPRSIIEQEDNNDNSNHNVSPVSTEDPDVDNDTLWSDGDATKEHKMMLLQTAGDHNGPAFTSGGFDSNTARMESTGPSFQTPGSLKSGGNRSLVDSIIDDISMTDSLPVSAVSGNKGPMGYHDSSAANNALTTPQRRGRFSSTTSAGWHSAQKSRSIPQQQQQPLDPTSSSPRDAPSQSMLAPPRKSYNGRNNNNPHPPKVTEIHGNREEETLSTVTDPSETPVIYTYKKNPNIDDDSVSQITSSLAGNSYGSSHYLQNVPMSNFGSSASTRSRKIGSGISGLSWMDNTNNNSSSGGGHVVGSSSRRIHHRKGGLPGPYGRDHRNNGRGNSSRKSTASPPNCVGNSVGGGTRNSGGSGSGSIGSVPSYDGGQSNLDEIEYALNADCAPRNPRRQNHRRLTPTFKENGSVVGNKIVGRERSCSGTNDDLSTVESSRASGDGYIDVPNVKSNVSRLGMGGVSCGAQSVSENATVISENSTSSSQGLFQSLAMLAWKAQHHAGRFFFPTSPDVIRHKKYDRSDSVDELADILLEEGAGGSATSLSHRKQSRGGGGSGVRHGDDDYDDEEEIDYFSRAMSASNAHHGASSSGMHHGAHHASSRKSSKQRKKYVLNGSTVRIGGLLFFVLTAAFTVYRKPKRENDALLMADTGRAGVGGRVYDGIQEERQQQQQMLDYQGERNQATEYQYQKDRNNQVFEYQEERSDAVADPMADIDAYPNGQEERARVGHQVFDTPNSMVDNNAYPNDQAEIAGVAQPGQPNNFASDSNFRDAVQLPSNFQSLANVDDKLFQRGIDIPFYWHVPRSGGGTMNDLLGSCLHLTLAADAGGGGKDGQEEILKVLRFSHQVSYVNVDTSTHQGISRAKNLNLTSSGLADVVISPLLHEASSLFTPTRRGRMFAIFRHPVERAASLFYFIQESQWQQPGTRNDQFAHITIEQFYKNGFAENNWMTRFLTNELTKDELTENDLNIAKEVLRQKCLVGLLEEKGETFERIQKYFGWRPKNEEDQDCLEKKVEWAWPMKHKHPDIEEGSRAWRLILAANKFDLRLFEYAEELFVDQGEKLFHH